MNTINNNNKYKKEICLYWKKGICKKDTKYCSFAHGEDDIIKEICKNGIKCYNENCIFKHPEGWNAFDNKQECKFCIKGFCDKEKKRFNHMKVKYDIIENNKDKEIIFNVNDFPELNEKVKNNDIKNAYINEDINRLNLLKKELYKNYKLLSSTTDWSNDLEIDNNIKELNNKYIELKQKIYQNKDIFNNDLDLNIFDVDSYIKNEEIEYEDNLPNIEITINGVNIKENYKDDIKKEDKKQKDINKDNILNLLNEMETFNEKTILEIKTLLNKNYNNNEKILKYKYQLNEIISKIYLLKINYNDIIC
jgi:hypothetical protein